MSCFLLPKCKKDGEMLPECRLCKSYLVCVAALQEHKRQLKADKMSKCPVNQNKDIQEMMYITGKVWPGCKSCEFYFDCVKVLERKNKITDCLQRCKDAGKMLPVCKACQTYFACAKEAGLYARRIRQANTVVNRHQEFTEVIIYRKPFYITEEIINAPKIDRGRLFTLTDEILKPNKPGITLQDFQDSQADSRARALDNFYGYGLNNDWEYFITLTFSAEQVDRMDDEAVKKCWSNWLKDMTEKFPDMKVLLVPEYHKKGGLHFHGFIADATLTLSSALYPADYKKEELRGTQIYSRCGDPVFNIVDWKAGFCTCCVLPPETDKRKVINYCQKYMAKSTDVGYNKKRYYRTRNLTFKGKECSLVDEHLIAEIEGQSNVTVKKDTAAMTIYIVEKANDRGE